ncbi:MAG: hypothetical protein CMM07_24625 [Rhodopirellula sp.]|nr:hypothetical protein [Rhodopirellula sp.]
MPPPNRFTLPRILLALSLLFGLSITGNSWAQHRPDKATTSNTGQKASPLSWIQVPGRDDQLYLAQRTPNGTLVLTANECFFPKLGLACLPQEHNETRTTGKVAELNKGESFSAIGKWNTGDVAEWGLFLEQAGDLQFRVFCDAVNPPAKFEIRMGQSTAVITANKKATTQVIAGRLRAEKQGFNALQLICNQASPDFHVLAIELTGRCLNNAAVLRKRWRPAAAHTKFTSSKPHGPITLWVMEMDAVPGDLPFYSPITTPFGYYGPTWQANGKVNSGFNFSMWSFSRGKKAPPIEQLSHLLAAGNRNATLGGFSHEGTGVKIRNWEPLAGRQGQRQTLALRVEPGEPYDTYYSYFYANDEKRWRLFGIGNRYNNGKPLKSLWVGSFVEVPGRASVQRTGAYPRTMRYRGWCMDKSGKWFPLDRMANGNVNKESGLTHTHRGLTDDGWFFLQTGGWTFRKPPTASTIELTIQPTRPDYLNDEDIKDLINIPSSIEFNQDTLTTNPRAISCTVRNCGSNPLATLYYGNQEALTFADQWQHEIRLPKIKDGSNQITLPKIDRQTPLFLRLRLTNDEGIFWSNQTLRINQ